MRYQGAAAFYWCGRSNQIARNISSRTSGIPTGRCCTSHQPLRRGLRGAGAQEEQPNSTLGSTALGHDSGVQLLGVISPAYPRNTPLERLTATAIGGKLCS